MVAASMNGAGEATLEEARRLDAQDPLAKFRDRFLLPEGVYLDGEPACICALMPMINF